VADRLVAVARDRLALAPALDRRDDVAPAPAQRLLVQPADLEQAVDQRAWT